MNREFWTAAVERHHAELLRIVAALLVMAGMVGGVVVATLPRRVHLAILDVLRAAESAVRRLIVMAAWGIRVVPRAPRAAPSGAVPRGSGERVPSFPLFDTRLNVDPKKKRVAGFGPNIRGFDEYDVMPPARQAPSPDDMVDAGRLCRRLQALLAALEDLPKQARRLARILARGRSKWQRPMRPGRPPGYRSKGRRAVDEVLADCQELALMALEAPDTS